jgi:hypothetical protein
MSEGLLGTYFLHIENRSVVEKEFVDKGTGCEETM